MKIVYEAEIGDYWQIDRLEELRQQIDELVSEYIEEPQSSSLETDYENPEMLKEYKAKAEACGVEFD